MHRIAPAFLLLATICSAQTPGQHNFTPQDWAALRSAHAVAVSPDGSSILYNVTHGADQGPEQTEWWIIDRNATRRHKLDLPQDFSVAGFTRFGDRLYGTLQLAGKAQFAIFALHGLDAQAVPITTVMLPSGVHNVTPSPDGSTFALTYDPRPPDPEATVRTVVEPEQTGIYVVRADGTGGKPWCESLNHVADLAWSPDSVSLAVISSTPKIGFHTVSSFVDLCSAQGDHRLLERPTAISSIAWSGGGRQLVFLSTSTHVLTPDHVWTVPISGGAPLDRTPSLGGSALALASDPQGRVWVAVQRGVRQQIDTFTGDLTPMFQWSAGNVDLPVFSPYKQSAESLAFTVNDPGHTANVAVADSNTLHTITTESQDQLNGINLAEQRAVHWTSKEGIALEGVATFPPGFRQDRRYPFLVLPHGGPEANDGLVLDPFAQIFAGLGYVVLQPEYRGSTGYGSAFLEAIYQHFGDRAYQDVDSATDFALAQGWADPNRLAMFGWSAGGFMTAWTVTKTPRYKAAIEGAGITDWSNFLWTSDIGQTDFDERWPEDDPEPFRRFSSVDFATHVATPLLILHGAADARVPTYQSLEYFQILAARGKTVRLVLYPGSPHFPRLWQQRLDVMRQIEDWLAKYNP